MTHELLLDMSARAKMGDCHPILARGFPAHGTQSPRREPGVNSANRRWLPQYLDSPASGLADEQPPSHRTHFSRGHGLLPRRSRIRFFISFFKNLNFHAVDGGFHH